MTGIDDRDDLARQAARMRGEMQHATETPARAAPAMTRRWPGSYPASTMVDAGLDQVMGRVLGPPPPDQ
jgi:hypothetical protein